MSSGNLSNDVLLQIMSKLPMHALATLRKTCSGIDALVERYRHHFSKNAKESIHLEVEIEYYNKQPELAYYVRMNSQVFQLYDPVHQLSAIRVSEVTILFDRFIYDLEEGEDETPLIAELIKVLQKLRISPEVVHFEGVGDHLVEEVLQHLRPQNIEIRAPPQRFDYAKISQMSTVQKAKKVEMSSMTRGVVQEYDKIKGLTSVQYHHANKAGVRQFIMSALNSETIGRLRTIEFDLFFPSTVARQESVIENVLMRAEFFTLFDDSYDPKSLLRRNMIDSHFYLVNVNVTHQMVIVEKETYVTIKIFEKKPSALLETLVELVFDEKKINVDINLWREEFEKAESIEAQEDIFWDIVNDVISGDYEEREDDVREILFGAVGQNLPRAQ